MILDFVRDHAGYRTGDRAVGLLTHSGSRGAGHKTATHYVEQAARYTGEIATRIPPGYEWLDLDAELGQEYLAAMHLMGDYAHANHDLIHDHFLAAAGLRCDHRVWNRHNYAWVEEEGVVHRKGATPAAVGVIGLIPGSSGTASYLVRGLGNEASLNSSSHGAGRWFRGRRPSAVTTSMPFASTWLRLTSCTLAWSRTRLFRRTRISRW